MPNRSGNAYGLTVLCPLKEVDSNNNSVTIKLKKLLFDFNTLETGKYHNPMSKVPNTYFSRFYILEDVFFEDYPYELEHLKSKYLVFTSNFYGELDEYLGGMYDALEQEIKIIWQDCYGFDVAAINKEGFKKYIKKCQVETTFYFNGSTDDSLNEQLKSLYIKQEFSKFVFENSHKNPEELQQLFKQFIEECKPGEAFPRWKPAGRDLSNIVDNGGS